MLKTRKLCDSLCMFVFLLLNLQAHSSVALEYRLDTNIIPDSYDIWIKPYVEAEDGAKQFTFDGEVNITLHAEAANLKQITLHKDYVEIDNAALHESASKKLIQNFSSADWSFEQTTDKLTVNLAQPLNSNVSYVLRVIYTGQILNGMAGVYHANYLDAKGNSKTIVLTQAQRVDARTILPCFDEPSFKAKFRMQISRPRQYISIFNTRLVDTYAEGSSSNRYVDKFEWSPKMSTYLIAFMICEYETINQNSELILLTRPEFINFTVFSYEITQRTLQAYGEYTKQPYKTLGNAILQKASSPTFPHNGMENWGLVLYKDAVLVHEPGYNDGWHDKQYTLEILVHETAHMWFGNSVTFQWWNFFWLNEAFARYYQYFMANELYPEYQLDEQFVIRQVHSIFGRDALNTTQPLTTTEQLIQTPTEIESKFSAITYSKGAAIVRMLRNLMGHDNFDKAIQNYLAEFHLKNVVPNDLFKHLKQHWPTNQYVDLDTFFHDWTEKVGFPTLFVKLSKDKLSVSLEQQRFLLNKTDGSDQHIKYTIPLTYTTNAERDFDNLEPKAYLNASVSSLTVKLKKPINWIIFNIQQSNYHRVFYNPEILTAIKQALMEPNHSRIHVINRAHIIDDLFNFALAGMLDYEDVFSFVEYLKEETEFTPWFAAFKGLQRVSRRLTVQQQSNFGTFILDLTAKVYKKLGFESSQKKTILDVYNRNDVVHWNCKYSNNCNAEAQVMLQKANATNTKPSPDFRETLYCSAVRFGDFSYYNIVDFWFLNETRSSEKELLLRALGCTKHFAEYHFARILIDPLISQEYTISALSPLYTENPENVSPVFYMITRRYENLQERLGSWSALADIISDIADYFTTEEQHASLDDFITAHGIEFGCSLPTLQRASRNVENNLQWAKVHLKNLNKYLEYRNSATFASVSLLLLCLSGILSLGDFKVNCVVE